MKITKLFSIALLTLCFGGLFGFGNFIFLKTNFSPRSALAVFSPTIDGHFTADEHWELAENVHTAYLQTDVNHVETYNYIYANRTQTNLYVLVDLCSDTTNDTQNGNWIALWIDANNSQTMNPYESNPSLTLPNEFNTNIENYQSMVLGNLTDPYSSLKGIFYNLTSNQHYLNLSFYYGMETLNSSGRFTMANKFESSPNFNIPHQIFEFNISLTDLGMNYTQDYGLLVEGYGSLSSFNFQNPINSVGFYALSIGSAAVYCAQILSWMQYTYQSSPRYNETNRIFPNPETTSMAVILIASMEKFYFPCGTSSAVQDLHDNPRLFNSINATNLKFSPIMVNGSYSSNESWDLAENIHAGFLQTDPEHISTYNYIFANRVNGSLYVIVDLPSEDTDHPWQGEWISLWIAKNSPAYQVLPNFTTANATLISDNDWENELKTNLDNIYSGNAYNLTLGQNLQGIFFNVSDGEESLRFSLPNGSTKLDSTVRFNVTYGFNTTLDSNIPHRFFKFQIPLSDLNLTTSDDYRLLVQGYGTTSSSPINQNVTVPGFYTLSPTSGGVYLAQIMNWLYYIPQVGGVSGQYLPNDNTTGNCIWFFGMLPKFYFLFGTSSAVHDLKSNPSLFQYMTPGTTTTTNTTMNSNSTTTTTPPNPPSVLGYPIVVITAISIMVIIKKARRIQH